MNLLASLGLQDQMPGAYAGSDAIAPGNQTELLHSYSPIDGKKIGSVVLADEGSYEALMKRAEAAFAAWRSVPAPKRGEIIRQMGDALRAHKDALGSLVSLEMGKSKQEGDGEVQEMIDMADFAVGQSRMLYGKTMHSERPSHRMYEQWHPYGVVGVVSAFNFPVAVWAWNAFIAAICGNVTLWKPSPKTPLVSIAAHKICAEVLARNHCPDIFMLWICNHQPAIDKFVEDKRIPLLSFTGSTQVGRIVAQKVAARMGHSILELGGNNAIIVDETADLKLAIPAIVFGAVGTAGQRCTTTRRLFVHKSRYEAVLETLKTAYAQIRIGSPLDTNNHMGPLTDEHAVKQYLSIVEQARARGAKIEFGGQALDRDGYYVSPCLISGVENNWPIVQEETFAPILYVMPYDSLDEAIALQNAVPQGLSSSLFTLNLRHAEQFLSAIGSDCGIANVNIGTSGAEIGGAFGGEKDTGGGRESGSDAWKAYMRRQTNTINWGASLPLAQGIRFEL